MMIKIFDLFEYFDIRDYYDSNELLISCCPVHEGDNTTAFNINIDQSNDSHYGKWFCNTQLCHSDKRGNDILSLVWMLLDKKFNKSHKFPEVIKFCESFSSGIKVEASATESSCNALDKLLHSSSRKRPQSDNRSITKDIVRKHLIFPAQYYINRGFSERSLDFFDVGICTRFGSQMFNRVVFPVYDEDDKYMIGCVGRAMHDDHPRKWINQKGFNKSNFLYNYGKAIDHITRSATIILTEGQGDVIRLWESGIQNVVGMFGSKISDGQEFLIQKTGASNIVIMSDNDTAGESCKQNIYERFQYLFNIYPIDLPRNDIGDMTVDEINKVIKPQIEGRF